jgi:hypothetical protein
LSIPATRIASFSTLSPCFAPPPESHQSTRRSQLRQTHLQPLSDLREPFQHFLPLHRRPLLLPPVSSVTSFPLPPSPKPCRPQPKARVPSAASRQPSAVLPAPNTVSTFSFAVGSIRSWCVLRIFSRRNVVLTISCCRSGLRTSACAGSLRTLCASRLFPQPRPQPQGGI